MVSIVAAQSNMNLPVTLTRRVKPKTLNISLFYTFFVDISWDLLEDQPTVGDERGAEYEDQVNETSFLDTLAWKVGEVKAFQASSL